MRSIILLSGEIATGKTLLGERLVETHGFRRIGTGSYLRQLAQERSLPIERSILQQIGDGLDAETNGRWVVEIALRDCEITKDQERWLLDSVRRSFQISCFRTLFPGVVIHAHLTAPDAVLRDRYENRRLTGGEYAAGTKYEDAKASDTERQVRSLVTMADIVIDTSECSADVAAQLIEEYVANTLLSGGRGLSHETGCGS